MYDDTQYIVSQSHDFEKTFFKSFFENLHKTVDFLLKVMYNYFKK